MMDKVIEVFPFDQRPGKRNLCLNQTIKAVKQIKISVTGRYALDHSTMAAK